MLAQQMKLAVENFHKDTEATCRLFTMADEGQLTARNVTAYIKNAEFIVKNTLGSLTVARDAANARGMTELAAFYQRKMDEEDGHDLWAKNDLKSLKATFKVQDNLGVSPWIERIIDFNRDTIARDPHLYLSWQLFAEYFTVLAAPRWLKALEEKCGVPAKMLSVVGNHAELDKDHVDYALKEFDGLTAGKIANWRVMEALFTGMGLYRSFCDELANAFDKERFNAAA
jgi:hypothetical protein